MTDIFTRPSRDPIGDAIAHLDDAFDALTMEGVRIDLVTRTETDIDRFELCISEELERMDRAMRATPESQTMLAPLAAEVKRALVAIAAARNALKAARP